MIACAARRGPVLPAALPPARRGRWRSLLAHSLLTLSLVAVLSPALVVASARPAAALAGPPVLPPVLFGGVGAAADTAAGAVVGVGSAGASIVIGGLATGYAIGWAGVQAFEWAWAKGQELQLPSGNGTYRNFSRNIAWTMTTSGVSGSPYWTASDSVTFDMTVQPGSYGAGWWSFTYADGVVKTDGDATTSSGGLRNTTVPLFSGSVATWAHRVVSGAFYGNPISFDSEPLPARLDQSLRCVAPNGDVSTVTASSALSGAPGDTYSMPALSCPAGTHAAAGGSLGLVGADGLDVGSKSTWTPSPRLADPNDPQAGCLAAASSPCQAFPIDPSTGQPATDWTGTDSRTGAPATGTSGEPAPGCQWGPYRLTAAECFPDPAYTPPAPDPSTTDSPTPTPTPTAPGGPGVPEPGEDGGECFPHGWRALNPVQWVYQPVLCALQAAFVPRTTATRVAQLGESLKTRAPFAQLGGIVTWLTPQQRASRCLDWRIGFPEASRLPTSLPILNSCDESNPIVKALHGMRPLLVVVLWVSAVAPLGWWAWKQYAPGATGTA